MPGTAPLPYLFASGTAWPGWALPVPAPLEAPLPEEDREDLIRGTKYAYLSIAGGKPVFTGVGVHEPYGVEGYAKCAYHPHEAPQPECGCGFWIGLRPESRITIRAADYVELEVEFGGRVIDCGHDPLPAPPWGYRAQWQRVLSVTLPPACACCQQPPRHLMHKLGHSNLSFVCDSHCTVMPLTRCIERPVSWLRENLPTEIRPGTLTDDATIPPPLNPPHVRETRFTLPPAARVMNLGNWSVEIPTGAAPLKCQVRIGVDDWAELEWQPDGSIQVTRHAPG